MGNIEPLEDLSWGVIIYFFIDHMNKIRKELHGIKFSYDINSYNFKAILEDLYGCELDKLHNYLGAYEVFKRSNDQATLAHKVFYSNFEKNFQPKYIKFMHDVIKPLIGEEFYYQKLLNRCRKATSLLNTVVRQRDGYRSTTTQDHGSD